MIIKVLKTMRPECAIRKSEKWQWRHNLLTWRHCQFFWRCFDSLVKFSCCFKLHVNIIAGSRVMTIFLYKGLNRNPEIGNTPVWVLPIIWKPGELGIPNLARMFLIKCSYMMQDAKVTAFTVIAILRENLQGVPTPTRLSTLSTKLSANKRFTQIFFRYKII